MSKSPSIETRHRAFAEYIAAGKSQREAARLAGYTGTPNSLNCHANRMVKRKDVQRWIEEARQKASVGRIIDAKQRRELMSEFATNPKDQTHDRIAAVKVLNDMDGLTIKKIHHADADGGSLGADLAQVTVEKLRERIAVLKGGKK